MTMNTDHFNTQYQDDREDGAAAACLDAEMREQAMHWYCPFCGKDFGESPLPHPGSRACCGEVGHLEQLPVEQ